VASTAAFDKHPQSQERGMTLDLGFSAFFASVPTHWRSSSVTQLQFTLVDCPGHASLIRTIMGGAAIIRTMMLVVDAQKGIQTQTAECLVIGEITAERMLVVVNKLDLLPEPADQALEKLRKKLAATFKQTKFADAPIVAVAAANADAEAAFIAKYPAVPNVGVRRLIEILQEFSVQPDASVVHRPEDFLFAFDHGFVIKGQGTVVTGTVLRGSVVPGQNVEFVDSRQQRPVKSIQQFHRPSERAVAGDRAGLCVTKLDAGKLERGIVSAPGAVPSIVRFVAAVERIRFFKAEIESRAKFHISMGHSTAMGTLLFFADAGTGTVDAGGAFDAAKHYLYHDALTADSKKLYALVTLETPIDAPRNSVFIGARLDTPVGANVCRLAFTGAVLHLLAPDAPPPVVYKPKRREGDIDRVVDEHNVIAKNLFNKGADMTQFVGLRVTLSTTGAVGEIVGAFGQQKGGKFKVYFRGGMGAPASAAASESGASAEAKLVLEFKKLVGPDDDKKSKQILQ
jgi:selenocysteine-specific elongation factor